MGSLPFLRLSSTSICKYYNNHLQKMKFDKLLQVKRWKHLCRFVKTKSVNFKLTENSQLKDKLNHQSLGKICPPLASTSYQSSLRGTVGRVRMFSTSSCRFSDNKDDDILKDDPFLKDLLKEIREDFSSKPEKVQSVERLDETEGDESKEKVLSDDGSCSSSDSDTSSSSDDSSTSDKDENSTLGTDNSGKLVQGRETTPAEPDIDIGGFISLNPMDTFEEVEEFPDTFEPEAAPLWESPIDLKRGETGVYDLEELVVLLKSDNAKDICVIRMPDQLNLGDHIIIVTAWSYRHMKAMAKNVLSIYKLKKNSSDRFPLVSGVDEGEWAAFDLGNIILHVFKEDVREKYDLETLWAVGPEFDEKSDRAVSQYILEDSDMDWLREFYKEKAEN